MKRYIPAVAALALAATPLAISPAFAVTPTSYVVTTADDPATGTACPATAGNPCSLRAAVTAANTAAATAIITFAVPGPFLLAQGQLSVSGSQTMTIQGNADGSTVIDGATTDRVFLVQQGADVTVQQITVQHGHAVDTNSGDDGYGGAFDVNTGSKLTVIDSTLRDNTADQGGGAIDNNTTSDLTVVRSLLSGNTADVAPGSFDGGGGIDANTASTLSIVNSTLTANAASGDGGGAIAGVSGVAVHLVNDTITGNQATGATSTGGGLLSIATGTADIANTIITANTPDNCSGPVTDNGYNLEVGTSCAFADHAVSDDARLAAPADNGGPTMTMALQPGSPAVDAASATTCAAALPTGAGAVDQRGVSREQGSSCDIGAFERVATTTTLTKGAVSGATRAIVATVVPTVAVPGPPTGSVQLFDHGQLVATKPLAGTTPDRATFTVAANGAGHRLTARYLGTALFHSSTTTAALKVAAHKRGGGNGGNGGGGNGGGGSGGGGGGSLADTGVPAALPAAGLLLLASAVALRRSVRRSGG